MADNRRYLGGVTYTLSGSGVVVGATTLTVNNFLDADGNAITMAGSFGTKGYGTIQPGAAGYQEFITFTGVTDNGDGTSTLTGVSTQLAQAPYTETSGIAILHPGASTFIISNTPGFYDGFTNKNDDETIVGTWTFPAGGDAAAPVSGASYSAPTNDIEYAAKKYVDDVAVAGAPDANETTKGLVEEATQAEVTAKTATGSTGAKLFITPTKTRDVLGQDLVTSTGSANAYVLTVSPAATAYATGQIFRFKANFANTATCTINVSGLGAKTLKTPGGFTLVTGDILNNQIVECYYDGTDMIVTSVLGQTKVSQDGRETYAASSAGSDTYAVTLVPAPTAYATGMVVNFKADVANTGAATLNVNALGAKTITLPDGSALSDGDIAASTVCEVVYDGTNFQLITPSARTASIDTVPNTAIPTTWHTWVTPLLIMITSGPSYTPLGWTLATSMTNPGDNNGGAGITTLGWTAAGSVISNLPGYGSNLNYTAASAKAIKVKCRFRFAGALGGGVYGGFGIVNAATATYDGHTANSIGARFVLGNATVYAVTASGSGNTNTDVSASLTYTDWNTFEIVLTPGTDAKYYINGTLVATHATNLPAGAIRMFGYGCAANATLGYTSPIAFSLET